MFFRTKIRSSIQAAFAGLSLLAAPLGALPALQAEIRAYPQPARNFICFSADLPGPGTLKIEIYNMAKQHVASFTETAALSGVQEFCENDLGSLVSGPYFYRSSINGFHFPTRKLWIQR